MPLTETLQLNLMGHRGGCRKLGSRSREVNRCSAYVHSLWVCVLNIRFHIPDQGTRIPHAAAKKKMKSTGYEMMILCWTQLSLQVLRFLMASCNSERAGWESSMEAHGQFDLKRQWDWTCLVSSGWAVAGVKSQRSKEWSGQARESEEERAAGRVLESTLKRPRAWKMPQEPVA